MQEKRIMEIKKEQTGGRKTQEIAFRVSGRTDVVINNLGYGIQMHLCLNPSPASLNCMTIRMKWE